MTCCPLFASTNSMNRLASFCSVTDTFGSIPMHDGRSVTGLRYLTRSALSEKRAPIPAELWTRASLICPLVRACNVGPFVGWMTRPLAFSFVK